MSAILTFLGGSVFRMIFGEISSWLTAARDHAREMDRMRLQAEIDAAQHARNLEAIKVQAELGVKMIQVQGEAAANSLEMEGWAKAVANATAPSGIWLVDLWNGIIRPSAATIALYLWVLALMGQEWKMSEWDQSLVGVVLGFFFASRMMAKVGK